VHVETLKTQLETCAWVVARNLDGFDQEKSLRVLPGSEMSLNWVLGHIVSARDGSLRLLNAEPFHAQEDYSPYGQRSSPLTSEEALPFEELVRRYQDLQQPWLEGLARMTAEDFAQPTPFSPRGRSDETVGSLLAVIVYHEVYHSGQMGPLRRNAGLPNVLRNPAA
jgi:uncharacterized damage-inducible protein DinB